MYMHLSLNVMMANAQGDPGNLLKSSANKTSPFCAKLAHGIMSDIYVQAAIPYIRYAIGYAIMSDIYVEERP
jgi:hypothetical protein